MGIVNTLNIFISFSGTARQEYAIKFLNFLNKYGLHCWYDQHELLLGDLLEENITSHGIETAEYCILIINKSYLSRQWPCEEAVRLYDKLKDKKEYVIFPILLDISKEDVMDSKMAFILEIKYQFLHTGEPIDAIGFQILNRIFYDINRRYKFQTIDMAINYFKRLTLTDSIGIYNALDTFNNLDETNYRDRTIFLICLIRLFNNNPYEKAIREISYLIFDNRIITFDIYKITESIFLIGASLFTGFDT
jgi:hypothetical protein